MYEGEFSRNQIHGTGRMVYHNGDVYNGLWKGGIVRNIHCVCACVLHINHFLCLSVSGPTALEDKLVLSLLYIYMCVCLKHFPPSLLPPSFSPLWQRQGQGKYTSKREGVYEGTWFNDLRHGKGRLQYPNKDVYEGSWELNLVNEPTYNRTIR